MESYFHLNNHYFVLLIPGNDSYYEQIQLLRKYTELLRRMESHFPPNEHKSWFKVAIFHDILNICIECLWFPCLILMYLRKWKINFLTMQITFDLKLQYFMILWTCVLNAFDSHAWCNIMLDMMMYIACIKS